MASTEKTRQQLVESMRKTKAAPQNNPPAKKKRVTAKRARTARTAKPDSPETPRIRERYERRMAVTDPYQGGRRVWPD
jgi:hypothetical protein